MALLKKKLPETVSFYNSTKYGVDIIDQMARQYTIRAGSRRWPVQVFYNILDLVLINAWVLYKESTGEKISRHRFSRKLAEELRVVYCRSKNISDVVKDTEPGPLQMRHKCQIKRHCKGNKTVVKCKVSQVCVRKFFWKHC